MPERALLLEQLVQRPIGLRLLDKQHFVWILLGPLKKRLGATSLGRAFEGLAVFLEHGNELGRQIVPHRIVVFLAAFASGGPFARRPAGALDLALESALFLVFGLGGSLETEALFLGALLTGKAGCAALRALCLVLEREALAFVALALPERLNGGNVRVSWRRMTTAAAVASLETKTVTFADKTYAIQTLGDDSYTVLFAGVPVGRVVLSFGAANGVPEGEAISEDDLTAIGEAWFAAVG